MVRMARLVPNPQDLIEQLLRILPHPTPGPRAPAPTPATEERILDAALAAFSAHGIRATTMSQIARDAGISREWLYKHFRNRDAIVLAIIRRDSVRFIDGLAVRAFESDELATAVTEAFVYAIEFLWAHPLFQRALSTETDAVSSGILLDASPAIALAVETGAGYLCALGDLEPSRATIVAETIIRLVVTIALVPRAAIDLRDSEELRRYAAAVVPALLRIEPGLPAESALRSSADDCG
jgi:AcrR family transcriptional regulator